MSRSSNLLCVISTTRTEGPPVSPRIDEAKMRILMPERIVDRHVGGNTTYARHIEAGLKERNIDVGRIRSWSRPQLTLLQESLTGLMPGSKGDVLHYVADTGPLVRT